MPLITNFEVPLTKYYVLMFYPKELIKPQKKSTILYVILKDFNVHKVRADLITIIQENRKCSIKEAGDVKTLLPTEVKLILEKYS